MVTRYKLQVKEKGRWHNLRNAGSYGEKSLAQRKLRSIVASRRRGGARVQKARVVGRRM